MEDRKDTKRDLDCITRCLSHILSAEDAEQERIRPSSVWAAEVLLDLQALMKKNPQHWSTAFEETRGITAKYMASKDAIKTTGQMAHPNQLWAAQKMARQAQKILEPYLSYWRHYTWRNVPGDQDVCGTHKDLEPLTGLQLERLLIACTKANVKALAGDTARREQAWRGLVPCPYENEFLFKKNPILLHTMALNMSVVSEEFALGFANSFPTITAMVYVYEELHRANELQGTWNDLIRVKVAHQNEIFLGEPPSTYLETISRLLILEGYSDQAIDSLKRHAHLGLPKAWTIVRKSHHPRTAKDHKPWDLFPTETTKVMLDQYNGTGSQKALYVQMDKAMQKEGLYTLSAEDLYSGLESESLEHLLRLRVYLPYRALTHLDIDYITLTRACLALFEKVDKMAAELVEGCEAEGFEPIPHVLFCVPSPLCLSLATRIVTAHHEDDNTTLPSLSVTYLKILRKCAVECIDEYIQGGATGVPELTPENRKPDNGYHFGPDGIAGRSHPYGKMYDEENEMVQNLSKLGVLHESMLGYMKRHHLEEMLK